VLIGSSFTRIITIGYHIHIYIRKDVSMMNERVISIEELKQELLLELKQYRYSLKTIQLYKEHLNRIKKFMASFNREFYTPELGEDFIRETINNKGYAVSTIRFFRTVVRRLNDCYYEKGYVHSVPRKDLGVEKNFQDTVTSYLRYCSGIGNHKLTVKMKERACHFFCQNLTQLGCSEFHDMDIKTVSKAILLIGNSPYWTCIKDFLLYLTINDISIVDFSTIVPKPSRNHTIPSTYSIEEIRCLESAVDKTSAPGKRNFAILLLASRLGIRAGDIARLHFSNLDFEKNRIRFYQSKTENSINLPMIEEIKAALIDYINNERPNYNHDNVFLCSFAPYGEISYSVVSFIIKKYMDITSINTADKKRGPHSLRASLATSMINDGTDYGVVRKILGHEGENAIKNYAKLDIEQLRNCAIKVPAETGDFMDFLNGGAAR